MTAREDGQKILELHRYRVSVQEVQRTLSKYAQISYHEDEIFNRLIYKLSAYVLEEKVVKHVQEFKTKATVTARATARATAKIEVPVNWFEHLKRDHFPAWFLRRWPAKTRLIIKAVRKQASKTAHNVVTHTADFTQYAQFPASAIQTPEKYRGPAVVLREELNTPMRYEEDEND